MAHQHHDAVGHATADDEYLVTPPGAGYEHTDASVWIIVKFGLWLAVAAIIIHIGLWFLFGAFVQSREEAVAAYPLATGQEQRLPAEPRLQAIPVNEIYQFRRQEEAILREYRWIDRENGRVQIPISEAMRLTVERGLPARAEPADGQAVATPGGMAADSSSGRTVERRRQ
jgi:hypothetical protein